MKKLWFLLLLPVLALGALLVYQNLPEKRYARHMIKARLYANENNLTAAQMEYEKAYNSTGAFTPYVSLEVLRLMNRKSLQEKNVQQALANSKDYVRTHPDNKEGRIILSELAFQTGDLEAAFESVEAVLAIDPVYFSARMLLAQVRTRQGRLDLAEEQLRYLYRKFPDSAETLLPLADNLLKQGKIAEGRQFVNEVLAAHPANAYSRMLLVDSYMADRQIDSARAILEAWQKDAPPEMARPIAQRRSRLDALSGRFEEAKAAFAPFRETKEENIGILSELAVVMAEKGEFDSALSLYAALGEAQPRIKPACERMGLLLHLKNHNPARALESAKILQLGGKNPELLPFTLAAYQSLGQEAKAVDLVAKQPDSLQAPLKELLAQLLPDKDFIGQWALVEYFRQNSQPYWVLIAAQELHKNWPASPLAASAFASQLANMRQFGAAAKVIEGRKKPTPQQRGLLLTAYTQSGQRDKAAALAEKILAERPGQRGLNLLIAEHAMFKGDHAKAGAHYEKELALDPSDPVALNNLVWEYGIVQADFAKAKPFLDRLAGQKIRDARIMDTMGWILARNGKTAEGAKYIRDALNLVPDHPSYLYHQGWIQAQAGEKEAARKSLLAALAGKAPFDERKEAEALLAEQG